MFQTRSTACLPRRNRQRSVLLKDWIKKNRRALLWWGGLALLLAAAAVWILVRQAAPRGSRAKIVCGDTAEFYSLAEDGVFGLEADPSIRFEIRDGAIRFIESDCPDHICENAGFLSRRGDTAACLPRRTVLTVIGGEEGGTDAVAG